MVISHNNRIDKKTFFQIFWFKKYSKTSQGTDTIKIVKILKGYPIFLVLAYEKEKKKVREES